MNLRALGDIRRGFSRMPGILEPFSEILEGSVRLSSDDYTDSLASAGNLFLLATDRRTFFGVGGGWQSMPGIPRCPTSNAGLAVMIANPCKESEAGQRCRFLHSFRCPSAMKSVDRGREGVRRGGGRGGGGPRPPLVCWGAAVERTY